MESHQQGPSRGAEQGAQPSSKSNAPQLQIPGTPDVFRGDYSSNASPDDLAIQAGPSQMAELLQEAWPAESTSDGAVQGLTLRLPRRSTPISDISVWVECYCLMAAVLCARYPARGPDMFMYLRRIVHCARKFEGQAWVTYDRQYRRQAAASRSLNWATEDQLLYNEAFSGNAKPTLRCKQCLSEHHSTETCPDIPRGWPIPNENPPARAQQETVSCLHLLDDNLSLTYAMNHWMAYGTPQLLQDYWMIGTVLIQ
eukprot:Em0089g15a